MCGNGVEDHLGVGERHGRPVPGVEVTVAEDGEVLVGAEHPQAVGYVFEGVESQESVFLADGRIATGGRQVGQPT